MFDRLDRNDDGVIDEAEMENARKFRDRQDRKMKKFQKFRGDQTED